MYCGKCGAKNEPGATFCGSCGAPLEGAKPEAASFGASADSAEPVAAAVQSSRKNKTIGIAAAAVVVVVAVVAIFSLFGGLGGRSDTKTVEQFFDAVFDADPQAIVDLIPKGVIDTAKKESGYTDQQIEDELSSLASQWESAIGALDFLGDSVKVSYAAVSSEDVDASQLSYLKEKYQPMDVDVSAARAVHVELHVKVDSLSVDQSTVIDVPVVKVGNSWYIDVMNLT